MLEIQENNDVFKIEDGEKYFAEEELFNSFYFLNLLLKELRRNYVVEFLCGTIIGRGVV